MILEAFSQRLHQAYGEGVSPEAVLHAWLLEQLQSPSHPEDQVRSVIHTEIGVIRVHGRAWFQGKSPSGERLLESLYEFCKSYDHWQFSRWLHELRASDFPDLSR